MISVRVKRGIVRRSRIHNFSSTVSAAQTWGRRMGRSSSPRSRGSARCRIVYPSTGNRGSRQTVSPARSPAVNCPSCDGSYDDRGLQSRRSGDVLSAFVMKLAARMVRCAGVAPHPDAAWILQVGGKAGDAVPGLLRRRHFRVIDGDARFRPDYAARLPVKFSDTTGGRTENFGIIRNERSPRTGTA